MTKKYKKCPSCNEKGSEPCSDCGGTGKDAKGGKCKKCGGWKYQDCTTCNGNGQIEVDS